MATLTACGMPAHERNETAKKTVQAPIHLAERSQQRTSLARQQVHQLLIEQDYVGTIKLIQDKIGNGLDEQVLAEEYLKAANGCIDQAESLLQQGVYAKAALLLKTVQESYPQSPELQQRLATSPAQLTNKIDICTEELMEAGLVAYRSGEFTTAIDAWAQVLEFNPDHQTAQSSIQTTQLQVSNLKSMESKN